MTAECMQVREWYKALKAECTCAVCEKEGREPVKGQVHFHHIDPATKQDHVSNMVFKNMIRPDSYGIVNVAVEFMKCIPICERHHIDMHKAPTLPDMTSDPFYSRKLNEFRSQMINTMPAPLYDKVMGAAMTIPLG